MHTVRLVIGIISLIAITMVFTVIHVSGYRFEASQDILEDTVNIPQNNMFASDPFPKTIHQIWLGYDKKQPPESWQNGSIISQTNNPDFLYKLWNAQEVLHLLEKHYAWFLPTYHSYPYNVQRADAARYFIIHQHGGIYMDMDEISMTSITDIIKQKKLEHHECVLPEGTPSGVTNYVLMCKEKTPFMAYLTSRLRHSKGWYGIPYATVMWSTGPRFLSGVYDKYRSSESIYVMPGSDVTANFRCLFGQSWFSIDGVILHIVAYPFIRMGIPWYYLVIIIVVVFMCVILACLKCCQKCRPKDIDNDRIQV